MNASSANLERFISRVYRRLVVLRLVEWAGMGFAAGCAIALLSIGLLRNQLESPLLLVAIIAGCGALLGFVTSLLRRPRILDAAVEADRQLHLADLLATAWQLEKSPQRASFENAVLLIADERAAHLQPRSVVLHRLGMRAWSGIGLAGALVLTVAFFTANPIDTEAATSPFLSSADSMNVQQDHKQLQNNTAISGRHPNISSDHPGGEDEPLAGAGKTDTTTTNASRGQNTDAQTTNSNGTGSGSGQSASTPDKSNLLNAATDSSLTNKDGNAASGVGNSTENAGTTSGANTPTSAGNARRSPGAPAWKSDAWPAAQQAADQAISTGQIPPAYHDLVREYFKR